MKQPAAGFLSGRCLIKIRPLPDSLSTDSAGAGAVCYQFTFQTLHAASQDGLSLEFVAATEGRIQYSGCKGQSAVVGGGATAEL